MISVILPCYKAEKFLDNIMSEVLGQSYKDFELIVVSNGDGQAPQLVIADSYAKRHENVTVLKINKGGVSNARNVGMEEARGEWITFIDADDHITSDHLQRYIDAVNTSDKIPDIVVGGFVLEQPREKMKYNIGIPAGGDKQAVVCHGWDLIFGSPTNKMYRRSFLADDRFEQNFTVMEDAVFNLKLLLRTDNVATLPMTGYTYIQADSGSAVSKYHETFELAADTMMKLLGQLYHQCLPDSEILKHESHNAYYYGYAKVRNLFKPGSPLTLKEQHDAIKRMTFCDERLLLVASQHRISAESLLMKIWILCLRTRSAWITTFAFALQYWLKNHFFTIFIKLWPMLSRK